MSALVADLMGGYDQSDYSGGKIDNFDIRPVSSDSSNIHARFKDEYRMTANIPMWRFLASILLVYGIYCGIATVASLCTVGSQVICSFALIFSSLYFVWAVWWDAKYVVPPTWSFLLQVQGFSPGVIIVLLIKEAMLVGLVTIFIVTCFIFTFANLSDLFKSDCTIKA
jgi:hypothetical protein